MNYQILAGRSAPRWIARSMLPALNAACVAEIAALGCCILGLYSLCGPLGVAGYIVAVFELFWMLLAAFFGLELEV